MGSSANLQSSSTYLQSSSAELQTSIANPQSLSANQQASVANQQASTANQQASVANQQASTANQQASIANLLLSPVNLQPSVANSQSANLQPSVTNLQPTPITQPALPRQQSLPIQDELPSQDFLEEKNRFQTEEEKKENLSLAEVKHIRTVLSQARIESLPLEESVRRSAMLGSVCALCFTTKFRMFRRGVECYICSNTVCRNCCQDMAIPTQYLHGCEGGGGEGCVVICCTLCRLILQGQLL